MSAGATTAARRITWRVINAPRRSVDGSRSAGPGRNGGRNTTPQGLRRHLVVSNAAAFDLAQPQTKQDLTRHWRPSFRVVPNINERLLRGAWYSEEDSTDQ